MIALLLGCSPPPAPVAVQPDPPPSAYIELSAPRLLRRISLDLRGIVPSVEELDSVEADAAGVATLRDAWLDDPALEDRLVSFLAERWETRVDAFDATPYDFGLDKADDYAFHKSIGEEPLRLAASVIVRDRPWTEIVTADYTYSNELLASIWPIDYPPGKQGWQESRYTDARPAAGVLATNGLWWRYTTNRFNNNRTRAAAIFRLLLCSDFLARPVSFSASAALQNGASSEEALRTDPYCIACHVSIEPVAASFFGFWWQAQYSAIEMSTYHAEREPLGPLTLEVEPAWFGDPVYGLADLGAHVADDPRFHRCAAESMAAALWRREVDLADFDRIDQFREAYEADGYSMKTMLRAITDDPVYRAGALTADADANAVARELPTRLLSADQLTSAALNLSGFHWENQGYEQLGNDVFGYRVLAGGVNGQNVTHPQQEPGVTWALVVERLAQATADAAVRHDLDVAEGRLLFRHVDASSVPGDAAFDAELRDLTWRLLATRATEADIAAETELWSSVYAEAAVAAEAWTAVVTALLRDPAYVSD